MVAHFEIGEFEAMNGGDDDDPIRWPDVAPLYQLEKHGQGYASVGAIVAHNLLS